MYLKLRPYRQSSLAGRAYEKLGPRFYGPYQILEKIDPITYKLDLPSMARIHLVFHIYLLKKVVGLQPTSSIGATRNDTGSPSFQSFWSSQAGCDPLEGFTSL